MNADEIRRKFLGGLIGSALGDAIGELGFRYRNKSKLLEALERNEVLRYTDDTAMSLALVEHILTNEGMIEPELLGKTFHEHFKREPWRGYGPGPPTIFQNVNQTEMSYVEAAKFLYNGEGSFGNGAAMRIIPVGLYYFDASDEMIREAATRSSIPTHAHPLGVEGACILAKATSLAMKSDDLSDIDDKVAFIEELIQFTINPKYEQQLRTSMQLLVEQAPLSHAARKLGSNVTALKSVPFAIHAFLHNPKEYRGSLLETIMISRDKDTVGTMSGGMVGAHQGINCIPIRWIEILENKEKIENLASRLANLKIKPLIN